MASDRDRRSVHLELLYILEQYMSDFNEGDPIEVKATHELGFVVECLPGNRYRVEPVTPVNTPLSEIPVDRGQSKIYSGDELQYGM